MKFENRIATVLTIFIILTIIGVVVHGVIHDQNSSDYLISDNPEYQIRDDTVEKLVFTNEDEYFLQMDFTNNKLIFNPDYTPDETAKLFIQSVEQYLKEYKCEDN